MKIRPKETWVQATPPAEIPRPASPIKAKPSTVAIPGGNLWFLDSGASGDAVLLLHPYTGSARSWGYQFPAFSRAGFRVIAPSNRGAYGTTAPRAMITQLAEDIIILLDELKIENIHLLGSAFGGMLALRLVVAYPDRFKTLTLSCSLGGIREESYLSRQRALLEPEFTALPAAIKELSPSYRHSNPDGLARWRELEAESASAKAKSVPAEERRRASRIAMESGPDYAELRSIDLPVNLIFGGADLYAPPTAARLLHEQFPNSRLTLIQETGHSAYWEQPFAFNEAVLQFLKDQA